MFHFLRRKLASASTHDENDVEGMIAAKWQDDKRRLPLTDAHRNLYNIIHREHRRLLGTFPDLIRCPGYNDMAQWLKLFDQRHETVDCSDKLLVRDFFRRRVGPDFLICLCQVHDRFDDIDFSMLPSAFVIKPNHDSGSAIVVRDKNRFDPQDAKTRIDRALAQPFGWFSGEWAYKYVRPKVLIERLIPHEGNTPPPDYKFYCVDGRPVFMHYIYDRGPHAKEQAVDLAGRDLNTPLYPGFQLGHDFRKPKLWDDMISAAKTLSKGFKFVRVDLYCVEHRIYVGELTFWPGAGFYGGEGQKLLGKLLKIDRRNAMPFLIPELEATRQHWPNFYTGEPSKSAPPEHAHA